MVGVSTLEGTVTVMAYVPSDCTVLPRERKQQPPVLCTYRDTGLEQGQAAC